MTDMRDATPDFARQGRMAKAGSRGRMNSRLTAGKPAFAGSEHAGAAASLPVLGEDFVRRMAQAPIDAAPVGHQPWAEPAVPSSGAAAGAPAPPSRPLSVGALLAISFLWFPINMFWT